MEIFGDTKVCALIGDPVAHSLSPKIHNTAFQHLELNYVYVAFRVDKKALRRAIHGIRALKIHGLNVTMPLKTSIIPCLDEIDSASQGIGAVNTVLNKNEKLIGYNTDGIGALMALKTANHDPIDKKVLILGAGGASRAVSYTLANTAREIAILNRTMEKARNLANELNKQFGKKVKYGGLDDTSLDTELKDADILINATSVGMQPNEENTPVNQKLLRSDLTVLDLVYHPIETRLLREAAAIGAKTINGVALLVHQGALSFEKWTGIKAPVDVMMDVCMERLTKHGVK